MYICIYIYTYVYMYMCIYVYIHIYTYVYIYIYVCIYIYICMYICIYIYIYVHMNLYAGRSWIIMCDVKRRNTFIGHFKQKSPVYIVALLWRMICNLGDPMSLRHPVIMCDVKGRKCNFKTTISTLSHLNTLQHQCAGSLYTVAKTHRMPQVAGHFSQKSH